MKVMVVMDSFKGSLSSVEAGNAVRDGIRRVCDAEVIVKPLADGGEGTTEALVEGLGGSYVYLEVSGPTGKKTRAKYGIMPDGKTAVMEMAEAAGIMRLKEEELDPWNATTYGVGEMIADAMQRGCREFIVGIGGSATTDGGVGMLQALGFEFYDGNEQSIEGGIGSLDKIADIRAAHMLPELRECHFKVACDVRNPLYGEQGAVYVYGTQKGVAEEDKPVLDEKMRHYAQMTEAFTGIDNSSVEGAGAAGGLGFAFLSYLPDAQLQSGIDIVLEAIGLEEELMDSDIVITGEGQLDSQTAMGKVPVGVAKLAKKYHNKVIAFAGSVTEAAGKCNGEGIDAFFPIVRGVTTLEDAMNPENAKKNLSLAVEQVFRLLYKVSEKHNCV